VDTTDIWPAWAANYRPESASSLGADASWTPLPGVEVTDGDRVTASWERVRLAGRPGAFESACLPLLDALRRDRGAESAGDR
jgi:hypothetical protein